MTRLINFRIQSTSEHAFRANNGRMSDNSKIIGILVIIIFAAIALAYTYLFNHQPYAIIKTGQSGNLTSGGNGGTKVVVYNSVSSNGNEQTTVSSTTTAVINKQIYSVPIVIRNLQISPTPAGLQDMIVVPSSNYSSYIDPNWNNVEFTTAPEGGGSMIEAWVESNATSSSRATVVWVKLPMIIDGHDTTTIYMDFMNFPVLSRDGPTGEAPELSTAYAQYDNGALVFNFYDNFSGRGLNTDLWSNSSAFSSNPVIVNDGLTIGPSTSKQNNGYSAVISLRSFGQGVVEFYGTLLDNSTQPHYQDVGLIPASSSNACNLIAIGSFYGPGYAGLQTIDSYCYAKYSQGLSFGKPEIYSIFVPSLNPTNATATVDYANPVTLSFASLLLPQNIGFENQGTIGNLGPIYWIRQRDYPPGGVLPAFSFGKLQ